MFASEKDREILKKLREVDTSLAQAKKAFEALPQRQAIMELRQKKAEVLKKKTQVQDMLDVAEEKLTRVIEEDEKLAQKQTDIEALLQEVKGDYRSVESRSKELNGIIKRRETLSKELGVLENQVNRISPVMKQVMQAYADLETREAKSIESFQKEGGLLQARIAEGERIHTALLTHVDTEVAQAYKQAVQRCGGIASAELQGTTCGACRNTLDSAKLIAVRAEAPLAICPFCNRLLIIEE